MMLNKVELLIQNVCFNGDHYSTGVARVPTVVSGAFY